MEIISNDTNIWLDFYTLGYIDVPFQLNDMYTFLMSVDAINDEITSPADLRSRLIKNGLVITELSEEEFRVSEVFACKYIQLSLYDRFALSIAKEESSNKIIVWRYEFE